MSMLIEEWRFTGGLVLLAFGIVCISIYFWTGTHWRPIKCQRCAQFKGSWFGAAARCDCPSCGRHDARDITAQAVCPRCSVFKRLCVCCGEKVPWFQAVRT